MNIQRVGQIAVCVMNISMTYRVYDPPPQSFLSFYPPLSSLSAHGPLCLAFDFLCFMRKLSCPEGTDLLDCFDPVVMILSFASATSFSLLQSPLKML